MPCSRRILILALFLALLVTGGSTTRAGESEVVHFGFDPGPGLVFIKSIETYSRQDLKDRAPLTETEVSSEVRVEFEQGEHGSWSVHLEPLWAKTRLNGAIRPNAAQEIVVSHANRLDLDDEGRAVGGDGFEELMDKFERQLDPHTFSQLRQSTNAETMRQGEIGEWNRPFEGLRGEEITVGETWKVLAETPMQGNVVPLSGSLEFQGWTELDGYRALKLIYRFDASGEAYAAVEDTAERTLNLRPEDRESYNRHNLFIAGETTWLVVPERGLVLYEKHEQNMKIPLSAQPDAPRGEVLQRHTYRYTPATDES